MGNSDSGLAFMFPGQGSQSVGMLRELAAEHAEVARTFAEASEVLGYDLWRLAEAGGAAQVADVEALRRKAGEWLQDPAARQRVGGNGRRFVEAGRGALGRVEAALAGWIFK